VKFGEHLAEHVQILVRIEVPTLEAPTDVNPLGVVMGWSRPVLAPMSEVTARRRWTDVRSGVYIVCEPDGTVRYVGSIRRRTPALGERLLAHLKEKPLRRATWARVALIRTPDVLAAEAVRRTEGRVGRALDPQDNERLPAVPSRDPWIPRTR
jgi:hypothetical protein